MNLHGSLRGSQPCIVSLIMGLSDEASTDRKTDEDEDVVEAVEVGVVI